jgi:8-amino-7-oxononanoate synthase
MSIIEGAKLTQCPLKRFTHNNLSILQEVSEHSKYQHIYVIIEGIYSMHGDIGNVPELSSICNQYANVTLIVDEAHSIGVLGKTGKGVLEHFGLHPSRVGLRIGTFSKALPSAGGFVAGSSSLIAKLRVDVCPFIYSAGLNIMCAAAAYASIQILINDPLRVVCLYRNAQFLRQELQRVGFSLPYSDITPIVPILCGSADKAVKASVFCRSAGILVVCIVFPVVPRSFSMLRVAVTAAHTCEQITVLVTVLSQAAEQYQLPSWTPIVTPIISYL